ncbi:MAG: glycosyltransferase family 1 protein [Chloroflexi bacterium]|nr:MAG: glycosyltransferase family 1 protein [Chloroflexota bacterium]
MKIVCISASQVPSSTANSIQVQKVCQALAQLGHDVVLLVPGSKEHPWEELASLYGLQHRFQIEWLRSQPGFRRYDFSMAAVRRAKALGVDLVYAWPPQAVLFSLMSGFPTMIELHGEPEGKFGPFVFRLILRQPGIKRFLPISQALADIISQQFNYKFPENELVVSPNGIDLERYNQLPGSAVARRTLGLKDTFTAAYTGHLYTGRGMGILVELAKSFPEVQFLWVGGRPEDVESWKKRLAEQSTMNKNICLTGFVENQRLPLYQAAADILLMPYEQQIAGSSGGNSAAYCSPMKMFEYMGCGRAILSSDLPVLHEVLNESNAVLCPPEDSAAWVEAFSGLMNNPEKRDRLGRQAVQDVQNYTWLERARKALEGFYEK